MSEYPAANGRGMPPSGPRRSGLENASLARDGSGTSIARTAPGLPVEDRRRAWSTLSRCRKSRWAWALPASQTPAPSGFR
jgi:hypothetical protein